MDAFGPRTQRQELIFSYSMKDKEDLAGLQNAQRLKNGRFWTKNAEAGAYLLLFNEGHRWPSRTSKCTKVEKSAYGYIFGVSRRVPPTSRQNPQCSYRAGNRKSIRKWKASFLEFSALVVHCDVVNSIFHVFGNRKERQELIWEHFEEIWKEPPVIKMVEE